MLATIYPKTKRLCVMEVPGFVYIAGVHWVGGIKIFTGGSMLTPSTVARVTTEHALSSIKYTDSQSFN